MLTSLRLSAEVDYRRETGMAELDRRLLIAVYTSSTATPLALTAALGHDKGQVSRALKRLEAARLIRREGLRGPVTLAPRGERITATIMAIAARRNADLVAGVAPERVGMVTETVQKLTAQAVALLARERALAGDGECNAAPPPPPPVSSSGNRLLAADLMTLLIYLQRSAALAYKRLTGLSSFDWQVLSQVAEHRPLPLARLILMLGRDKGQAGRTVKRLEDLGLVERQRATGRRAVLLEPTARGLDVYAIMEQDALRRNEFLTSGIGRAEMKRFLETLDQLTENAERLREGA